MHIQLVLPVPPATPVTQLFGENPQLYARWGYAGHNGIDFGAPNGTLVTASADGVVAKVAYESGGYGVYLTIAHGDFLTYYAHLRKVLVRPGQRVKAGDSIAESNNTGFSTGPHLHFGLKIPSLANEGYGNYHDPSPYFSDLPASESQVQEVGEVEGSRLVTVTAGSGLYVRSAPAKEAPALGVAPLGTRLIQQAVEGDWIEIAAYVHRDWVK